MKKNILDLGLQIFTVMVGVFLGVLASEWKENSKRQTDKEMFKQIIATEIRANRERINRVLDYHNVLRDSSAYLAQATGEISKPAFFKGTQVFKLPSSAYQTGIQTGTINELSLSDIQTLNNLYNWQESYNELAVILLDGFLSKDYTDQSDDIRKLAMYLAIAMGDVISLENDLLAGYENALDMLEGEEEAE